MPWEQETGLEKRKERYQSRGGRAKGQEGVGKNREKGILGRRRTKKGPSHMAATILFLSGPILRVREGFREGLESPFGGINLN